MKDVIVYGPGCKRCETAAEMVKEAARKLGIEVKVTKETDYARIAMAGVASTPGIAIDGKLVHAGGLPDPARLEAWLAEG
ncbi:MAG: thioredoxin family protein [Alphaproteobacteria bacterium]|nr:MAG: thioredoxin family protein [Alphaproteobacteria bacterium]